ncbi:hypothetical protein BDU57DRAFT_518193 [Ampelomyces quisqualis]|uniref:Uncharacterized protein n=1 Tax=Ampelomyces quisqualis TaxID=50730 RepID=A0A6A5QLF1_AMPQU|nr:hypothetical protein BDU57DRAFT_518193 [Ampelomyces quisqualis]
MRENPIATISQPGLRVYERYVICLWTLTSGFWESAPFVPWSLLAACVSASCRM